MVDKDEKESKRENRIRIVVRADDKTRQYGAENPAFTCTVIPHHDLNFEGKCSATANSPVNDYEIVPEPVGGEKEIREINEHFFIEREKGTLCVTKRALTVTATGVNKVYDGTTVATVTLTDDRVAGDVFTVSHISATFLDGVPGLGKTVSVSGISINGTDAGNYTFNTTATTIADITPRRLTVTATGVNKVYDGTTAATVTLTDDRVAGDVFTVSYISATFLDGVPGLGKTVSVSGISISGTDAGHYKFNTTATTSANITPLTISGGVMFGDVPIEGLEISVTELSKGQRLAPSPTKKTGPGRSQFLHQDSSA